MTLEQLFELFPDTTMVSWIPHRHGGGWVQSTAKVADVSFVDDVKLLE